MMRTFSPRWLAIRSASTLPAKPAPTISQSNTGHLACSKIGSLPDRHFADGTTPHPIDLLIHFLPGQIPGHRGKETIDSTEPAGSRTVEQVSGLRHRLLCSSGNFHKSGVAIRAHDI